MRMYNKQFAKIPEYKEVTYKENVTVRYGYCDVIDEYAINAMKRFGFEEVRTFVPMATPIVPSVINSTVGQTDKAQSHSVRPTCSTEHQGNCLSENPPNLFVGNVKPTAVPISEPKKTMAFSLDEDTVLKDLSIQQLRKKAYDLGTKTKRTMTKKDIIALIEAN